ncbi:hypothetical protein EDC01DRAFT_731082 [Geopyxis carbonaria]|nr:hypothetical protein EDC01DRAFT_731082 [Geopyxis carbonaria]
MNFESFSLDISGAYRNNSGLAEENWQCSWFIPTTIPPPTLTRPYRSLSDPIWTLPTSTYPILLPTYRHQSAIEASYVSLLCEKSWIRYGDCAETLPMAVLAATLHNPTISSTTEISCLAAFTTKLCSPDQPDAIPLKGLCTKCAHLMTRFPGDGRLLAGSGSVEFMRWTVHKPGIYDAFSYPHYIGARSRYSGLRSASIDCIYMQLEYWTRGELQNIWEEFILPYRTQGTLFRVDSSGMLSPITVALNGAGIPICSLFCAIAYVLSVRIVPPPGFQLTDYFLPLLELMATWCHKLCPWGRPNVVCVMGVTNAVRLDGEIRTRFMLGTSKPHLQVCYQAVGKKIPSELLNEMRKWRSELLRRLFGVLPVKSKR